MRRIYILIAIIILTCSALFIRKYNEVPNVTINIDGITSASIIPNKYLNKYTPHGFTDSQKKKALFIVGDLRHNSITFDLAYTAMKYFEENDIEVELRDLYKMKWNPILNFDEFFYQKDGIGKPEKDVAKEQNFVAQADYIIFVYPNWHDSAIAIVKGYQERVFARDFAYTADENGLRGMLNNKGLFTIMNCGFLGKGRGFIGDGSEQWDRYMKAYKVFDDDLANWWGMKNYGRFMNDKYPKNLSPTYEQELKELRKDLISYLEKTFINK